MKPLACYKPPVLNDEREELVQEVHDALNDIDREVPDISRHETRRQLILKYREVRPQFELRANEVGLADWLAYTIINRNLMMALHDVPLAELREMYNTMERLGYPNVSPLFSMRMIWANRLMEDDEVEEARFVVHILLEDVEAFRKLHPGVLVSELDGALGQLRQRVGV